MGRDQHANCQCGLRWVRVKGEGDIGTFAFEVLLLVQVPLNLIRDLPELSFTGSVLDSSARMYVVGMHAPPLRENTARPVRRLSGFKGSSKSEIPSLLFPTFTSWHISSFWGEKDQV